MNKILENTFSVMKLSLFSLLFITGLAAIILEGMFLVGSLLILGIILLYID